MNEILFNYDIFGYLCYWNSIYIFHEEKFEMYQFTVKT